MGYGRWSNDDYTTYRSTTKIETLSRDQVFVQRHIHESLDPAKIYLRESCDSQENPASTPAIFGLDVTGSMGFIAEHIAKTGLGELMAQIIEEKPIADPHLMFMALGDIRSDYAPLQVSQFEPDIRIIDQLRNIYVEGHGGGNHTESYDLPWYFAAHRTAIDAYNKRGKKGYLFTVGDEMPPDAPLPQAKLELLMGSGDIPKALAPAQLLAQAQEKYKVFHIIAEEGSECRSGYGTRRVREAWIDLMGANVIFMRDHRALTDIVLGVLKIAEGMDVDQAIAESRKPPELKYALGL
jgi:hypothetical protein